MSGERKLSYDLIRIIAAAMVVMIHVSSYLATYFDPDPADLTFIVGNFFNALGRAGTPMFLMLSGALLLDEGPEMKPGRFYLRKLLPLCGLLLFWLLFYAVWRHVLIPVIQHNPIDMRGFLDYVLWLKGRAPHLWYLFMLIGAYLVIPVLRLFVKRENRKYILGLILLSAAVQFAARTAGVFTVGMEHTVKDFVNKFHVEYATGYVPYLLIGWYVTAFPPAGKARIALEVTGAAAFGAILLSVWFGIEGTPSIRDYVAEMDTLPAMLYGAGLFTFICARCGNRSTGKGPVRKLSGHTFGVYITHVMIVELVIGLAFPYTVFHEQRPLTYFLLLYLLVCGVSLLLTVGLSRVPGLRKLIRE